MGLGTQATGDHLDVVPGLPFGVQEPHKEPRGFGDDAHLSLSSVPGAASQTSSLRVTGAQNMNLQGKAAPGGVPSNYQTWGTRHDQSHMLTPAGPF